MFGMTDKLIIIIVYNFYIINDKGTFAIPLMENKKFRLTLV